MSQKYITLATILILSAGLRGQSLYHRGSEAQDSMPPNFTTGAVLIYDDFVRESWGSDAGPATMSYVTLRLTVSRTVAEPGRLQGGARINSGRVVKTAMNNRALIEEMNQAGYLPDDRIEGWRLVMINLAPETAQGERALYVIKKRQVVPVPTEILEMHSESRGAAETYREKVSQESGNLLSGETLEFSRRWSIEGRDPVTDAKFRGVGVLKGRDVSGLLMRNRIPTFFSYRWTRASLSSVVGTVEDMTTEADTGPLIEGDVSFSSELPARFLED